MIKLVPRQQSLGPRGSMILEYEDLLGSSLVPGYVRSGKMVLPLPEV